MQKALNGLRIIEYGNLVSAPYCTKLLAGLGAEVIKIEKPVTGDESRSHGPFPGSIPDNEKSGLFLSLNVNKLGITLNIETTTGKNILRQLLETADVFVENSPPGFMQRFGLNYEELEKINPRLVMVSITPWTQRPIQRLQPMK
jgi:crotonobetainyl-CoA:carnitine CoA-transferase CaiB-like acyl-CoA transferase